MLLGALLAPLGPPARAAQGPQKWAVVVGINRYQSKSITPLEYAEADAREFSRTLTSVAGFPAQNVFLFTTDQSGYEYPTRTNIAFRFDYLIRQMGPQDTLVVYFSGHGVEVDGQSFLLTAEADSRSLLTLQQSALHARDLFGWLGNSKAGQVLLVVDACRNDPISGKGTDDNKMTEALARDLTLLKREASPAVQVVPSTATLFACSAGQRSYEWSDKGHGFFTYYLVEGLKGKAAGPDGRVTLQSLVSYVQKEVADSSSRWTLQRQVPWLRYEGPGADQWELARVAPGSVVTTRPDAEMEARLREAEERARREAEARKEAEARAQKAEEARRLAEQKARDAEQARLEAESKSAAAETARREAEANPSDPLKAEKARQSEAEQRAAEARYRQAEEERAKASDAAGLLNQVLALEARIEGRSNVASGILFVSQKEGAPYNTIRAALKAAPEGARILVSPGTYREDLDFLRGVEIEGEGQDKVIIEGKLSAIAPVRLRSLTVVGELQNKERFELVDAHVEKDLVQPLDLPNRPTVFRKK
ncbi:MAG: caspase family protein [Candidatus Eremiobacterota bacterium]